MTWLVVGLGNPGPEYADTRHNMGFKVVDALGENLRASYWKDEAGAATSAVRFGDDELLLVKPQNYVNVSGKAVARLATGHGVPVERIIVIHDDLDLPAGVVRVKRGGGHGGHNGLRSINESLGSGDYPRVKIGIGRPPGRMDPADFVLEPTRGSVLEGLVAAVPAAAQATIHVVEHGVDAAMAEYNGPG